MTDPELNNIKNAQDELELMSEAESSLLKVELLQLWSGYQISRALHVAAELGISDMIQQGVTQIDELAQRLECNPDALNRLMRLLVSYGIYKSNDEGYFSQSKLSSLLLSATSYSIRDTVRMTDNHWWNTFGDLLYSVKTGKAAFEKETGESYFDFHCSNPDVGDRFNRGMANYASHQNPMIVKQYDFSKFNTVLDVGGGKGAFLSEVLVQSPGVKGVLFDREDVITSPSYLESADLMHRCECIGGNFFNSVPSGTDAVILQHILHDWSDEGSLTILRNCRAAMAENATLLVIDMVVPTNSMKHPAKNSDLLMLTLLAGKERTEANFEQLLSQSGFKLEKVVNTPSLLSIIEAKPV